MFLVWQLEGVGLLLLLLLSRAYSKSINWKGLIWQLEGVELLLLLLLLSTQRLQQCRLYNKLLVCALQ